MKLMIPGRSLVLLCVTAITGCGGSDAPKTEEKPPREELPAKEESPAKDDPVLEGRATSSWLRGVQEGDEATERALEANPILAIAVATAALKSGEEELRLWGASTIGDLGGPRPGRKEPYNFDRAVPVLRDALRSGSTTLRWVAIWALGSIGPSAAAAIPEILDIVKAKDELTEHSDESLHGRAADALGRMAGTVAIEPLAGLAKSPDVAVRRAAVQALGFVGERNFDHYEVIVPHLVAALEGDRDTWVRVNACRALGLFSEDSDPALDALEKAAGDADREVAGAAKMALDPPGLDPGNEP